MFFEVLTLLAFPSVVPAGQNCVPPGNVPVIPGVFQEPGENVQFNFYTLLNRVVFPIEDLSQCGIFICIPTGGATLDNYLIEKHSIRSDVDFSAVRLLV
jgi:hypothetical protein